MTSINFKAEIESITLYKFQTNVIASASNLNSINIAPQVTEISIFESIFSPVIRAELVVFDAIGLFVNFPFIGEELVSIRYKTMKNGDSQAKEDIREELMVVESVDNITTADDNRSTAYMIRTVSLEAWQNARTSVQRAYKGVSKDAVAKIYEEFITTPLKAILPTVNPKALFTEGGLEKSRIFIIPNLKPFAAINMLADYAEPQTSESISYMFFQNKNGYFFQSVQSLFLEKGRSQKKARALKNSYRYISDEVDNSDLLSNDGRIVTALNFNRRHSTLDKVSSGYFQNKFFEINMAQKAFWITNTSISDITTISPNKLNTTQYTTIVPLDQGDEPANRVKYFIANQKENDQDFPISRKRDRWGKDLIAHIALSQIDITVTIPGDPSLSVGDLFHMELAESHAFDENKEDDLVSGFFLITEKRDVINALGTYTTSLRLQKDSYNTSVDRDSRYKFD